MARYSTQALLINHRNEPVGFWLRETTTNTEIACSLLEATDYYKDEDFADELIPVIISNNRLAGAPPEVGAREAAMLVITDQVSADNLIATARKCSKITYVNRLPRSTIKSKVLRKTVKI